MLDNAVGEIQGIIRIIKSPAELLNQEIYAL
jgi:hypothetical protein